MPPEDRFVVRFGAEPPQDPLPYGRWADTLQAEFLAAALRIDTEGTELGDAGSMTWFPDRTWAGRTFVPVTTRTTNNLDLFSSRWQARTPRHRRGTPRRARPRPA